ncbi:MAG: hypothetical protein QOE45_1282 [Frankiaceae bacterium]|jgi:hypothetical protein|nr:hypothetical protein [Frankiaceae bacterium]
MTEACPHLRELDAWFALALDVLAGNPTVRRDVLLLLGGAGTPATVASVTREDCVMQDGLLFVYPPAAAGGCLPLTPAFADAAGLTPDAWPLARTDAAADEADVITAVRAVDAAVVRITDLARIGGPARLRALRMHAWKHELGQHIDVLARCYGPELPRLLAEAGDCAQTRPADRAPVPAQRALYAVPVAS